MRDRYSNSHLESEFLLERKWAEEKLSIFARWLQVRNVPEIVEVGSFVGGFLAAGRQCGWSMLGVDPGKQVTDFCRSRELPVYCGTLDDAPISSNSVDAVVIWNTFDQLPFGRIPWPNINLIDAFPGNSFCISRTTRQ